MTGKGPKDRGKGNAFVRRRETLDVVDAKGKYKRAREEGFLDDFARIGGCELTGTWEWDRTRWLHLMGVEG